MASKSFSAAATGAWGGGGTSAGSGTGAGSSNNTNNKNRKVQALVVDAGAIIKGIRLDSIASELYTTSDVVAEIRDENGRKNLATATSLFGLTVKSVSDEAVREVSTFAKKTGDFATLSRTDIRVLALTWMLEKERKGTAHLRKEPIAVSGRLQPPTEPKEGPKQKSKAEGTSKQKHKVEDATLVAGPSNLSASKRTEIDDDEEDDGEGEWITPESLAAKKSKNKKKRSKKGKKVDTIEVACVTTDFAMQNVLLQMNLKLVSIDGMEITRVKNFVLRCHACFKTTSDMSKKFCPSCGNNTLIRATCSVDADGNMTIYLKKNFQYNLRGTKYSIPAPQGGRSNKDLILREDQKEYERAVKRAAISAKKSNDQLFDLDRDPLDRLKGRVEMPTIGYGRKNPNEARGRRRK
ncbi:Nin one binding Zn-ribbon like-domain-containing protein [Zopfochytrium polystomum]|nr:Nin one binding Zn-ribbon like-domain-containing protein [Zopfochytrium polystomum]